jgi:hypothetical protein
MPMTARPFKGSTDLGELARNQPAAARGKGAVDLGRKSPR